MVVVSCYIQADASSAFDVMEEWINKVMRHAFMTGRI